MNRINLLHQVEKHISELKAELEMMEALAQMLRQQDGESDEVEEPPAGSASATTTVGKDLVGMTIEQATRQILQERGAEHYADIADEAVRRGYSSGRSSDRYSIQRSFWDTLRRNPQVFERVGRGVYRLKS